MHSCPSCGLPLTIEEHKKGVCPVCKNRLDRAAQPTSDFAATARENRSTTTWVQDDNGPANRSNDVAGAITGKTAAWGTVRSGLVVIAVGYVLLVVCFGCLYLALHEFRSARQPSRVQGEWLNLFAGGIHGSALLIVMGAFLCMAVPTTAGRTLAILHFVCILLALIAYQLGYFAHAHNMDAARSAFQANRPLPWKNGHFYALGYTAVISLVVGNALFVLCLFAIARRLRRNLLGWTLLIYLAAAICFEIVRIIVMANQGNLLHRDVGLGFLLGFRDLEVIYAIGAAMTVWWMVMVFWVRAQITRALRNLD